MAMTGAEEQYFVYENRLASFTVSASASKKRTSNASARGGKTLAWPHKTLAPAELARAGFVFEPLPNNPDNVVCFLCQKALDGWEEDDNPLEEHLKHSPDCGWAITAAIEAEYGELGKIHPLDPSMMDARKATFAGKWPYESKKGFKCKTKQLVEAGWKYTPTRESDDMATCTYCQLALDGWESGDKPIDEHYKRSPNCPFFELVSQNPLPKKGGRSKAARGSKASRLSTQSIATIASDTASTADVTASLDDSVLTTTSVMSKKTTKGRKAPPKSRKTRAKKEEPVEILEDAQDEEAPTPKPVRGRKRASDEIADTTATSVQPASKKRAVQPQDGDTSVLTIASQDVDMADTLPVKKGGRKTTKARNVSQMSIRSQASTASLRAMATEEPSQHTLTDADAQMSGDENNETFEIAKAKAPAKGRPKKNATTRKASAQKQSKDFEMLDPTPVQHDEDMINKELEALVEETKEVPQDAEVLTVPKKGRKAGTRKASKQTKQPIEEPVVLDYAEGADQPLEEKVEEMAQSDIVPAPVEETLDDLDASTTTVVTKPGPMKRGRGRPSKGSMSSRPSQDATVLHDATVASEAPAVKRGRGRPSKESLASRPSQGTTVLPDAPEVKRGRGRPSKRSMSSRPSQDATVLPDVLETHPEAGREATHEAAPESIFDQAAVARSTTTAQSVADDDEEAVSFIDMPKPHAASPTPTRGEDMDEADEVAPTPATPRVHTIQSAKQATISPSQSPQSSDAENQPPSSKAANSSGTKRIVLAPVVATPVHSSPSRRNVVAGLQSTTPWTKADLDMVLSPSPSKGNGAERLMRRGPELTSPEKQMTVEEWIFYNASQAEKKLKYECEAMVSSFEKEGSRAMTALEGLVVE